MTSIDPDEQLKDGRHWDYLLTVVRLHLPRQLQGRVNPSDVVNESLLEAHQAQASFAGQTEDEFRAWLRAIAINRLRRTIRLHQQQCRDVRQEVDLEAAVADSAARLESLLADPKSLSGARSLGDHLGWLAEVLPELPERERLVVVMSLQGYKQREIAVQLDTTRLAVAGLLRRALEFLRRRWWNTP